MNQNEINTIQTKTRIGINPARGKTSSYHPKQVTVAMLTYIPSLEGYFENRLDILKLEFSSLQAHTSRPYDFYVFDNGSCAPVVDYLRSQQKIGLVDMLMLSAQNIGKIGALRILFSAAPGRLIAYSDDDIFYYPGWLEAHLEVMNGYPKAGMVSGLPIRNASGHAMQSLEELAAKQDGTIRIERKRQIQDEWEIDWALSTGRDPIAHLDQTAHQLDMVLRIQKAGGEGMLEAVGGANHFQFLTPKSVILEALPKEWSGKLMGSMIELDEAVDQMGYLRLSTAERYTRHLGNTLSQEICGEAARLGLGENLDPRSIASFKNTTDRNKHWILRIPGSRKILHAAYRRLFDILFK
jgi:hypothetical protein